MDLVGSLALFGVFVCFTKVGGFVVCDLWFAICGLWCWLRRCLWC